MSHTWSNKSLQSTAAKPETTTPNEDAGSTDEKHSFNWGALVLWPFVVLVLYVLSAGPVIMLDSTDHLPQSRFFGKLYTPIFWLYFNTPLHKPLGIYFHLWVPKYFSKNGEPRAVE